MIITIEDFIQCVKSISTEEYDKVKKEWHNAYQEWFTNTSSIENITVYAFNSKYSVKYTDDYGFIVERTHDGVSGKEGIAYDALQSVRSLLNYKGLSINLVSTITGLNLIDLNYHLNNKHNTYIPINQLRVLYYGMNKYAQNIDPLIQECKELYLNKKVKNEICKTNKK